MMVDVERYRNVVYGLSEILVFCHEEFGKSDHEMQAKLTRINSTAKDALELLKAQEPADYIPIDWLMNYAQLPTEFAISAWRKPKKEAEIKQAKSLDKPMSLDDALELLKAQEARVMTLEEVNRFVYGMPYIIEINKPREEQRLIYGLYSHQGVNGCFYFAFTDARSHFFDVDYGKRWRCWTSRPTDEQRETVKWNVE